MRIIGRKKEIRRLDRFVESKRSDFVVVYGRRRVGKTYLIREYFDNTFDFQVTGICDGSKEMQLANFGLALQKYFGESRVPRTWLDAFSLLQAGLEKKNTGEKLVVFFDEIRLLESVRSLLERLRRLGQQHFADCMRFGNHMAYGQHLEQCRRTLQPRHGPHFP